MYPDCDPDYHILRRYLVAKDAPSLMLKALDKLISRAGIRTDMYFIKDPLPPFLLCEDDIRRHVEAGKTQTQIAAIMKCSSRRIARFMRKHKIKPSYRGCGEYPRETPKRIGITEVRIDSSFPVPVRVYSPGYASGLSSL